MHLRQGFLVVALGEGKLVVNPLPGTVHGLHRRGGGSQNQQGILLDTAVLGHVPGVVAGGVLRLVAPLLLLI